MFGGLYHIAFEQILIAAKCRRLKSLQDIDCINNDKYQASTCYCHQCADNILSDEELSAIDEALINVQKLSQNVRSAFFYITGYIAKKENITAEPNLTNSFDLEDISFTDGLNLSLIHI